MPNKIKVLKKKYLKSQYYWLVLIFAIALAVRLFLAFQTDHFSLEDAYFSYRQVDTITGSGLPSFVDELSFSGRVHVFHPVFYYILAGFSFLFGPIIALKAIPNIFASLLVLIVFFIVFEITKDRKASLLSAIAAAFVPVFFAGTLISASIISFTLPLIFYCMYCFMRINEKRFRFQFLFFSFLLALSSSASFIFIFGLLLYLLFFKLEFKKRNRVETECILFTTFLTLWINVLIYKKAFLVHSYELIWQNIPSQVLASYFRDIDVVASVTGVGLLTLLFGVFAVYRYMFTERDKRTYLLMGFAVAVAALLWFKLITFQAGMMFLGAILVPLFGQAVHSFFRYLEKTRIENLKSLFMVVFVALLVITSVIPALARASEVVGEAVSDEDVAALYWLSQNAESGSVVLSTVQEGELVAAVAGLKNVADTDFILIRNSEDVFEDVNKMYTSFFKTGAVELMTKYGVDYIYFSPRAKEEFGIDRLNYIEEDCFRLVYDSEVKIYSVLCRFKTAGGSDV